MQHGPSWEVDSHSASQKIPSFMEPKGSLLCSQEPTTSPYPEPDELSQNLPLLFSYDPF